MHCKVWAAATQCLEKKLCYVTRPLSSYIWLWCIVTKLLRSLALCLYRLLPPLFFAKAAASSYRMFSPKSLSLSIYPKQPFCDFTDSSRTITHTLSGPHVFISLFSMSSKRVLYMSCAIEMNGFTRGPLDGIQWDITINSKRMRSYTVYVAYFGNFLSNKIQCNAVCAL